MLMLIVDFLSAAIVCMHAAPPLQLYISALGHESDSYKYRYIESVQIFAFTFSFYKRL